MAKRDRTGFVPGWTSNDEVDLPEHLEARLEAAGLYIEKRGEIQPASARLIGPEGQEHGVVLLRSNIDQRYLMVSSHRPYEKGAEVIVAYRDPEARHSVRGRVAECRTGRRDGDPKGGVYFLRIEWLHRQSTPTG